MRLSAYVEKYGINAFTADDFRFVGSKVSADPSRLILVGGQVLETWGLYFGVLAPSGDAHPLTEDVDWLGSRQDAAWLCDMLGRGHTELMLADPFDPSPNTGFALLQRPDKRVVMMDFLKAIVGPSTEIVEKLAVTIVVHGAIKLRVLHPLLCLESRMANLGVLRSKRQGNGPMQAQWSIDIARAYLLRREAEGASIRELMDGCRHIAECAEYKHGRLCFLEFGLDPLSAVLPELVSRVGGRFAADDWPRTLDRINRKRDKWARLKNARRTGA
jgi:hypothetical protein